MNANALAIAAAAVEPVDNYSSRALDDFEPTVSSEVRAAAEEKLLALADKHPGQQFAKDIAERRRLQEALNETALGGKAQLGTATETIPGKPRRVHLRELRAQRAGGKLVGAENVTAGPGHFFSPDVEKPPRGRGVRTRSINPPKDKAHQSTGVLFSTGRNRLGPQVTIHDALKEVRHGSQAEDAKLAQSFSRPYSPETFDPAKQVLLNPKGARVPRYLRAEQAPLALEQSTPREIAQHWLKNREDWAREVFPHSVADVPQEHLLGLRQIDKRLAEAITGRDRYYAAANSNHLLRLLDFGNNLNRAALIYLNPSYIPKNFTGNLAFLALQQGPFMANNLIRASQHMGNLSPETLRWISSEAGGGAAIQLAHENSSAGSLLRKTADIQGAGADRLPRIAAWLYEADRRGYRTEQQIETLRRDAKLRPVLNEISDGANQAMVKFSRAPAGWRRTASRALFIFPWVEGSTRYVGRLALDRPLAARGANEVRQRIEKLQRKVFGEGKLLTGSRIPLGHAYSKFGNRVVRSFNPVALSPIGQAAEVKNALSNAVKGNWSSQTQLAGFTQPLVTALIEAGFGIDTYHGRHYPQGMGFGKILKQDLIGSTDHPAIPLVAALATALNKPQSAPFTGPATKQPNYVQEGGPKAALWKLALGSARPTVEVNLPAVQAKGERVRLADLPPVKRSVQTVYARRQTFYKEAERLGKLQNGKLGPLTRRAFDLEAERQGRYAQASRGLKRGTVDYQRALAEADIQFLLAHGAVTEAWAKPNLNDARNAKDIDSVINFRQWVSRNFYSTDGAFLHTINETKLALEHAGAHGLG